MRLFFKYFFITVTVTTLFSCETEVDLFTEHKEKPVVFGLLDQSSPIQYFRINPTFIGSGDARDIASDPSQTNYAEKEIVVTVTDLTTGEIQQCLETTTIPLDPDGLFSTQNRLYYIDTEVDTSASGNVTNKFLVPGHIYRLTIVHQGTGEVFYGDTELGSYNDLKMTIPKTTGTPRFEEYWMKFSTGLGYHNYRFVFSNVSEVWRYTLSMNYHYTEPGDDPESKDKFINIGIGELRPNIDDPATLTYDFDGEKFYQVASTKLAGKTKLSGQRADVYVTMSGRDLDAYMSVSNSNLGGLSQEIADYSNIVNGLGIFSFRSTKVFKDIMITDLSAAELRAGKYTYEIFDCARFGTGSNSVGVVACD